MDNKQIILEKTMKIFNDKGLKFTMNDLAKELNMSKKTIYQVFEDKNHLLLEMVDYMFDAIKESEQNILEDASLTTVQKIREILGVMPESYRNIDLRKLYLLKEKYPKIYAQVEMRLENGWESTIQLLEQGMGEGVIRQIHIPIFKMMMEASLEQFFQRDILLQNQLSYQEALEEVVGILVDGILMEA